MASDTACGVLILKQGFLKKLPNQTKIGASLKRSYRQWVTFGLTREQQPYLAFYTNEESVTTAVPLKAIPLRTCCHITKSLNLKGHTNVFTLTLADRQLSLMAPTIDQMDDWCRILDTTLKSLGILKPDENLYTVQQWTQQQHNQAQSDPTPSEEVFQRVNVHLRLPPPLPPSSISNNSIGSRDPTSPLPPAPSLSLRGRLLPLPPEMADQTNNNTTAAPSIRYSSPYLHENAMNQRHADAASGETYETVWARASGPAAGGGGNGSSVAGSGAASPGALRPPPPIPHRSRMNNGVAGTIETTASRPRPQPPPPQPNRISGAGVPSTPQAETDYGVIWTSSANNNSTPAGRGVQPQLATQQQDESSGISPPRYTEHDESPAVPEFSMIDHRPTNFTSPQPATHRLQGFSGTPLSGPPMVSQTSPPYTSQAPGGATGYSFSPAPLGQTTSPSSPLNVLPSKMMEALGISGSEQSSTDPQVYGWNAPPLDDHDAPPPYMPRNVANRGPQKSLKQTQVDALEKEMNHAGGVKVTLRKTDCHLTIAWVDCCGATWIAGWNQKARPFLHNAFHVGDQIVSINGQVVENARMAHKLIKHSDDQAKITFILKRIPNARVFALKRSEDGEDLGFRREGGTGEINDVVPFGVAARHGVPSRAPTIDGNNLCNWFITEINMRPINLFFKEDEIEKRLNAVGKDISILIQPLDLINEMKTQLKKNLKSNYKDFVVQ